MGQQKPKRKFLSSLTCPKCKSTLLLICDHCEKLFCPDQHCRYIFPENEQ